MYCLDDGVLIEFEHASAFPNPEVTAMVTRDYRIKYNVDRLKICPDYEIYISTFHEMRHIYQQCCIDLGSKYPDLFDEPVDRIELWANEFSNYYVSAVINDKKYLMQDCEIDAISFAAVMMKRVFGINVVIPNAIIDEVIVRSKEIEDKLNTKKF